MRLKIIISFLLALCITITSYAQQRDCGSMEYLEQQIKNNPERANTMQSIEKQTAKWIANHQDLLKAGELLTIPVVVHVVYNTTAENISDAQVLSQITVLNDDFRRLNSDANGNWSQAADTEIEFCMATQDPNGSATTGITRTSTSSTSFSTNDNVKFNSSGGKDAWPAADYLNVWVCDLSGGLLGYAQFPGGPANTDGVVNDYQYFGTIGGATAPFDLGRTATHEVGHWLNLRHIWGDGGCGVDDNVTDTPESDNPNYGCATGHVSCGSTDMVENYMDYSDDACMNLFTGGQRDRMQALFGSGGARSSLMTSNGCGSGSAPTCNDGIQNGNETGVDCGGDCPPCSPTCTDNEVVLTLNFDNYPEETSWDIKDSGNNIVASGGTYGSEPDGSTLVLDECLVDGCYDFTIYDSYGDGICCTYGNGSYSLTNNGNVLASGGNFGSSETTNFCFGGPPPPTCDDGIQNGNETGIDCGGIDCPACPTCNDGIQNGNETGVDCGGTDCPPCSPTCTDNEVVLTLNFDNYPEETSWDIKDIGNNIVASGGTYGSEPDGSTLVLDECLVDGCYDFTIYDSYGDGICCLEGNGSYSLTNNGNVLASGGNFGSSEMTNFCFGGPPPTCNDGIQNGNETGIDCGGIDCPPCGGGGSTTLFAHYFESGWDGWIDGGSDCYRYNGSRSWEGNRSIRIRDNSGTSSAMTSSSYDVSSYSQLDIAFYFYPHSMENGEDFWVRFYDGSSWQTIAAYERGTHFNNGTFYVATVTISNNNYNFSSNAKFRFQCDASGNQDHIYIDAVTVTASGNGTKTNGETLVNINVLDTPKGSYQETNSNISVFPNPTKDLLHIRGNEIQNVSILSLDGQLISQHSSEAGGTNIDVTNLSAGLYIILVESEEDNYYTKMIKE